MTDVFEKRLRNFSGEGPLCAFNLALVAEALDIVAELNEQNVGGETVQRRVGEFKSWDPEVFKVDKDCEDRFIERLTQRGRPVVLLSEEAGRKEINPAAAGAKMYCVCDPFDGSYLFKRGIPDFWYSSLAFYQEDFTPACCAVGDGVQRKIAFAGENGAFIADLAGDRLEHKFKLDAGYREMMGRKAPTDLEGASIESYALKPAKFLLPLVDQYRELLKPFKMILPNGGPYGFVDVAEGKIDCYFAPRQPFVDVFSGIQIAAPAGIVVTDFDGREVRCSDNLESLHDVVASANPALHEKLLKMIARCR
jgi:fructose-1,6-bisphosphatase/inositol monophosphatase family enzyme